jgi:hypothetical protein
MSKRTLPDELRSVLLAHALQAPEPDDTVRRVLAATVAEERPRARRRWRGQHLLAAGAAAVLVLLLGGVGFLVDQARHSTGRSTSGANAGPANLSQASRAADGLAGPNQPNFGQPQLPLPYIAPGDGAGSAAPPAPSGLSCARLLPGSRLSVGWASKLRLASVPHDLYVYDLFCLSASQHTASTVAVYAMAGGKLQLQAVLVPASQGSQVDYLGTTSDHLALAVQLLAEDRTLIREDFRSTDGVHFRSAGGGQVAPACTPSDLTARIGQVDSISSAVQQRPYALQLTKHSAGICVLSGYPTVSAADGTAAAIPTLRGEAGGWGGQLPPIVQLTQGTTVSAMIEPAETPKCASSNAVAVSLPDGSSVGVLPADVALCGAQVHPIVSGSRGSS